MVGITTRYAIELRFQVSRFRCRSPYFWAVLDNREQDNSTAAEAYYSNGINLPVFPALDASWDLGKPQQYPSPKRPGCLGSAILGLRRFY